MDNYTWDYDNLIIEGDRVSGNTVDIPFGVVGNAGVPVFYNAAPADGATGDNEFFLWGGAQTDVVIDSYSYTFVSQQSMLDRCNLFKYMADVEPIGEYVKFYSGSDLDLSYFTSRYKVDDYIVTENQFFNQNILDYLLTKTVKLDLSLIARKYDELPPYISPYHSNVVRDSFLTPDSFYVYKNGDDLRTAIPSTVNGYEITYYALAKVEAEYNSTPIQDQVAVVVMKGFEDVNGNLYFNDPVLSYRPSDLVPPPKDKFFMFDSKLGRGLELANSYSYGFPVLTFPRRDLEDSGMTIVYYPPLSSDYVSIVEINNQDLLYVKIPIEIKGGREMRFQPRISTNGIGIYATTKTQMQKFFQDLWTTDLGEVITKMFNGTNSEGLMSVRYFYGLNKAVMGDGPNIGTSFILGTTAFDGVGLILNKEFVSYTVDSIPITRPTNTHLDYTDMVTTELNIPGYGRYKMDPAICYDKTWNLRYNVSLFTGKFMCQIYYMDGNTEIVWDSVEGDLSVECPINATAATSFVTNVLQNAVKSSISIGATIGGAAIGGMAGAMAGGSIGAEISNGLNPTGSATVKAGGFGPELSILPAFDVYILQTYPDIINLDSFKKHVGTLRLDEVNMGIYSSGDFVQISKFVSGTTSTLKYQDEIEQLMREGVYI